MVGEQKGSGGVPLPRGGADSPAGEHCSPLGGVNSSPKSLPALGGVPPAACLVALAPSLVCRKTIGTASPTRWLFSRGHGVDACQLGRRLRMRTFALACFVAATLLILSSLQPRETSIIVPTPVVAVCISGASRGPAALRAFVAALEAHLMEPARRAHNTRFELYGWLQDHAAAESLLAKLLPTVVTRRTVGHALPPELALDENTAIRTEHGHVAVGQLAYGVNLTNTLRMLRKLRGCEWLRQHHQARSVQPHALVVRIRPL